MNLNEILINAIELNAKSCLNVVGQSISPNTPSWINFSRWEER